MSVEAGFEHEQPDLGTAVAALSARVAELERLVAEFRGAAGPVAAGHAVSVRPQPQPPSRTEPAPPPPMPFPSASVPQAHASDSGPLTERRPGVSTRPGSGKPAASLESRLGSQGFNLVGIVALIAGSAWALKLAIEHGFLGPVARVLIGLAAGLALVLWSERFRRKGYPAFSYSLKAVGSAALYLTLWAAFHLYHLMPAGAALAAMILVTAWNAFMAWSQDAELLAGYALLGAFATPLLLSAGGNHEAFLFTYLGAIDLAIVTLLRAKPWRRLLLPVFGATVAFFIGWYVEWYDFAERGGPFWETLLFAGFFGAIFVLPSVRGWMLAESDQGGFGDTIVPVLLPLGNALFVGLATYSVFQDSGKQDLLAWVAVALAAVYLLLMRVQRTAAASAMHLALGVLFLTVAIPLKASGHTLTTAWLVEGLLLFWVSTRFAQTQREAVGLLRALSGAGYVLGLASLVAHWWWFGAETRAMPVLNRNLAASLVAFTTLAGAVWIVRTQAGPSMEHGPAATTETPDGWAHRALQGLEAAAFAAFLGIDLVAVLLTAGELGSRFDSYVVHPAFANPSFWTAAIGLAGLAASAYAARRFSREEHGFFSGFERLAGATAIGFNLLTILCVEREIGALWHRTDANLQRSLAISGFLMLYGVVLLAIGFSRRSAFTRWQALVLLLFTVCKVFLYDTLGLSAGYRVASFLGLGAVLMAVSFAYQKDLLHLKDAGEDSPTAAPHGSGA